MVQMTTMVGAAIAVAAPRSSDEMIERALAYVTRLDGTTPYGWWTGGSIPLGAPAWAEDSPPPLVANVQNSSCFCAGIPNLMLRVSGRPIPCLSIHPPDPECGECCGGTGAYGRNYSSVATPFDLRQNYSRGTLLGRPYRSVSDQGHVAVLLGSGRGARLLQSYSDCKVEPCPIVEPGVTSRMTLDEAYHTLFFCKFTYAIAPEDWIGA